MRAAYTVRIVECRVIIIVFGIGLLAAHEQHRPHPLESHWNKEIVHQRSRTIERTKKRQTNNNEKAIRIWFFSFFLCSGLCYNDKVHTQSDHIIVAWSERVR